MKDTSGNITQTAEFIRRTRDVGFKVFGGKDTLLYASLCHGAVGGVCTAANFMPELITDVYNKYAAGDLAGSLEGPVQARPGAAVDGRGQLPGRRQRYGCTAGPQGGRALPAHPAHPRRARTPGLSQNHDRSGPAVTKRSRAVWIRSCVRMRMPSSAPPLPPSCPTRRSAVPLKGRHFPGRLLLVAAGKAAWADGPGGGGGPGPGGRRGSG